MQSELLDITIIGCLVLLFWSTYRKRPSRVVRAWLLGWVLILVHFAALLIHTERLVLADIVSAVSLAGLFACGLVFLSAPPREIQHEQKDRLLILAVAGSGILACIVLAVSNSTSRDEYCLAGVLISGAWFFYGLRLPDISLSVRLLLISSIFVTSSWFSWGVWHGDSDAVISALLSQLFILVGITYIGTVGRISAGTLTVSLGLVAWASVFPVAQFLEHLHIASRIHPEFWNIPKYFVAFGMVLTLLEDEIIAANAAGQTLLFQASHDQLTLLKNRATLEQDLRIAVESAQRLHVRCALICFDLDRFKHVNDTYGHGVGDICLRAVGERLSHITLAEGSTARIGGEEFGIVLGGMRERAEAETTARQIQLVLREPIFAEGYIVEITGSIGIAVFPEDGDDSAALWRNADSAMYRAKKTGGDQVVCMSPEILQLTDDANEMELSLRHALRENGLELHYQPVFRLNGEIHSVEALVRLRHPQLGLIPPGRFVPVAEERGLIVPLGDWVFGAVCSQLSSWQQRGVHQVPIAMNISALQITSPKFAASALQSLSAFGIDPSLVAMEITETAMLRNVSEASRQIDALAAAGIRFSVDDFGVGYSSLGQLDTLDVDYLKIDRSFVGRMCDVDEARSIVAAIIAMAHSLGLRVVAEGIEDRRTLTELSAMGCDLFQGFYLAQPLSSEALELLLVSSHGEAAWMLAVAGSTTARD